MSFRNNSSQKKNNKAQPVEAKVGGLAPNHFLMQMFGPNATLPQRQTPVGFDAPGLLAQLIPNFTPGSEVHPQSPYQIAKAKKEAEAAAAAMKG